ncbi:MAG TPA: outer membrane lipoprotein chaperone LolA [Burkholderiaceae bacterium]|nr:outer membrane lipoprotein chaperone LolA [Burkholderiaceae bacterium]
MAGIARDTFAGMNRRTIENRGIKLHRILAFRAYAAIPALGLAVLAFVLPAGGALAADGLGQLEQFLSDTQSARGEFTQRVQRAGGQTLESTSGEFAFQRPGKFRWDVQRPFEQLMVADGKQLWFYDKDLNQVTIRELGDALGSTPAAILFGSAELERGFTLKDLGEHAGVAWVEALPKSADQGFDRIAIGFRNGLPVAMEVNDAFGRVSVFGFSRIERNAQMSPDDFTFTPPPGVDTVRQ